MTVLVYVGFSLLSRYPHRFNFPVAITTENAAHQYRLARTYQRWIKMMVSGSFAFLEWEQVRAAASGTLAPGWLFVPFTLFGVLGGLIVYLAKAGRAA